MILEALPSSLITTCKGSPFEDELQTKQLGKGKSSSYCSIIVPVNKAFFMSCIFIPRSLKRLIECWVIKTASIL